MIVSLRRRSRQMAVVAVIIVIGAIIAVLGIAQKRAIVEKQAYDALWTVASAALDYFRETGRAPRDLNALLDAGLLRYGEVTGTLVPGDDRGYRNVLDQYARRVRLSFPPDDGTYVLNEYGVVNRLTGEPLTLASVDEISAQAARFANTEFAKRWYSITRTGGFKAGEVETGTQAVNRATQRHE